MSWCGNMVDSSSRLFCCCVKSVAGVSSSLTHVDVPWEVLWQLTSQKSFDVSDTGRCKGQPHHSQTPRPDLQLLTRLTLVHPHIRNPGNDRIGT